MPWFKVDDTFWGHPKRLACPMSALGLWVAAGSWSAQQLTDGFVPAHVLTVLGGKPKDAAALVTAGLWVETEGGYRFHEWEQRQPSADEVRADRAAKHDARSAAGRLGGIASGVARRKHTRSNGEANSEANSEANAKQNEAPTRPDPTRSCASVQNDVEVEIPASPGHFDVEPGQIRQALRAVVSDWPEADPDELRRLA